MINATLLALVLSSQSPACGTQEFADVILETTITELFVSPESGYDAIRSNFGITRLDPSTLSSVVTDSVVCDRLVTYFEANAAVMYGDTAGLNAYGYEFTVFSFGPYHLLLVDVNDPPGVYSSDRGNLYVFRDEEYLGCMLV